MALEASEAAPSPVRSAASRQMSLAALEAAIESLGLEFYATVEQIAESLTALNRPSPLGTAKRALILQWIGAVGDEFQWEAELSDRNLMTVLVRAISIEHAALLQAEDVARRRGVLSMSFGLTWLLDSSGGSSGLEPCCSPRGSSSTPVPRLWSSSPMFYRRCCSAYRLTRRQH